MSGVDSDAAAVLSRLKLADPRAAPTTPTALGLKVSEPSVSLLALRDFKLDRPFTHLEAAVLDLRHAARAAGDHDRCLRLCFRHFKCSDFAPSQGGPVVPK